MCNFLLALITTLLAAIGIINGVPPNLPFPSPPPSPSPSPPPPFDQRVLRVYDGINSVSNVRKQPALTGEVRVSGTQSERYLSVLTSSLEVAQYMGIEAEVTASYSGLGTGSGSASLKVRAVPSTQPRTAHMTAHAFSFLYASKYLACVTRSQVKAFSDLKLTESSVVILASASRYYEEEYDVPRLLGGVHAPNGPAEALDFYRQYGDSYISKAGYGSQFYAMCAPQPKHQCTARSRPR